MLLVNTTASFTTVIFAMFTTDPRHFTRIRRLFVAKCSSYTPHGRHIRCLVQRPSALLGCNNTKLLFASKIINIVYTSLFGHHGCHALLGLTGYQVSISITSRNMRVVTYGVAIITTPWYRRIRENCRPSAIGRQSQTFVTSRDNVVSTCLVLIITALVCCYYIITSARNGGHTASDTDATDIGIAVGYLVNEKVIARLPPYAVFVVVMAADTRSSTRCWSPVIGITASVIRIRHLYSHRHDDTAANKAGTNTATASSRHTGSSKN